MVQYRATHYRCENSLQKRVAWRIHKLLTNFRQDNVCTVTTVWKLVQKFEETHLVKIVIFKRNKTLRRWVCPAQSLRGCPHFNIFGVSNTEKQSPFILLQHSADTRTETTRSCKTAEIHDWIRMTSAKKLK